MSNYKNPVPHFGGKRYAIQIVFDFTEWTEKEDAKKALEEWIAKNGIPENSISNITPLEEYRK